MKNLLIAVNGFLMALADSVPGVSGGTIAFIMGIYDKFIASLSALTGKDNSARKDALIFLIKLGIGWVIGFAVAVTVLATLFTERIYWVSSLFMGFIIFSIPLVVKEEKTTLSENYVKALYAIPGIALVVLITLFNPVGGGSGLDLSAPSAAEYIFLFVCGAIAICAMVLPGISGSTIMLIFGVYMPIITAVKDLLHLNFSGIGTIIAMGLGIVAGVVLVIRLIKAALEKHRCAMMYFILGMMAGSLFAIVRGPETLDEPQPAMTFSTFNIIAFIIGGAIIAGLQFFKYKTEQKALKADE